MVIVICLWLNRFKYMTIFTNLKEPKIYLGFKAMISFYSFFKKQKFMINVIQIAFNYIFFWRELFYWWSKLVDPSCWLLVMEFILKNAPYYIWYYFLCLLFCLIRFWGLFERISSFWLFLYIQNIPEGNSCAFALIYSLRSVDWTKCFAPGAKWN